MKSKCLSILCRGCRSYLKNKLKKASVSLIFLTCCHPVDLLTFSFYFEIIIDSQENAKKETST